MSTRKKILILCDSDLSREPRVIRQIVALKDSYQLFTAGAKASDFSNLVHYNFDQDDVAVPHHWKYPVLVRKSISLSKHLYNRFRPLYSTHYFEKDYWTSRRRKMVEQLKSEHFDVIIAHHWDTLPMAYEIGRRKGTKLVFNAHDYYPRQFEDNAYWLKHMKPLVDFIMKRYLPRFNLMFSAWSKIHQDFGEQYNVPSIIINNATEYNALTPQLRDENTSQIKIIHHGIANQNRKIEYMLEVMDYLDERFTLDMILVESPSDYGYLDSLKKMAERNPRIRFLEPVPTRDIAKKINGYDIGLFLLPPNGFNPTYLLPNKLFEFIQARLACLVSPNLEMKAIVEGYD